jgi:4,5-DOPA dioxygenase extradiol
MSAAANSKLDPLVRGYAMGSLSMTCYGIDADLQRTWETGAATLPANVPAVQANI